ncbi:MAG: conserved hypothetical protein [Marine Group I thaumarchaeote]|nr:MAG: conserved hypothetical protein [Marine Group I thaumarchaeote]
MSQTTQTASERKLWVLMSAIKETAKEEDVQRISPSLSELIDEWHSQGKFVWSGPLTDYQTVMAIFEAPEEEANRFYEKYDKNCSGILNCRLFQWAIITSISVAFRGIIYT